MANLTTFGLATAVLVGGLALGLAHPPPLPLDLAAQFPSNSAPPVKLAQASSLEQAVHDQVNQYRASKGLSPLKLDARISEQARQHSQAMANKQVPFGHQGFDQRVRAIARVINYQKAGENVAYNQGYRDPVRTAVSGWIKSTGHRQNMEGAFNLTGIGIAQNSRGEIYFTQIFIRSR